MVDMRRTWLMAMWGPLLVACVTTRPQTVAEACQDDKPWVCDTWGRELLQSGERDSAEAAFARACEAGVLSACKSQARLRMEAGDLTGAEAPLQRTYEADDVEGTLALAELHETRAGAGDLETAARLRREAPALDKPGFGVELNRDLPMHRPYTH